MISRILNRKITDGSIANTYQYFIWENEDLWMSLDEMKIDRKTNVISEIQRNSSNNRIGYYQFCLDERNFYKIYIIPKTIESSDPDELIKEFNKYIVEYLRLRKKYESAGRKELDDNIDDFILNHEDITIDDSLKKKYLKALNDIYSFFRKYRKENYVSEHYSAQQINDKLDLKKNVVEFNKSNVHQIKEIIVNQSVLANITNVCLKYFTKSRLHLFFDEELYETINSIAGALKSLLQKKFLLENKRFTPDKLLKRNTEKYFNKNKQTKKLYDDLIALIGEKTLNDSYKIDDLISLFYSPELMYELVVQEYLESIANEKRYKLLVKPTKDYEILIDRKKVGSVKSIPDFIICDGDKKYIIDAKWKILYNYESIDFNDVLKIDRDKKVHGDNIEKDEMILVYPMIDINKEDYNNKKLSYNYDISPLFSIKQIAVFDEEKDSRTLP